MQVDYVVGDRLDVGFRDHVVTVDQRLDVGGEDAGPIPTELLVAGLASCVAFYARGYLRRHELDATGLRVETTYRMGVKPARVAHVDLHIRLPAQLPAVRRDGLVAVASRCTVHSSITTAAGDHPRAQLNRAASHSPRLTLGRSNHRRCSKSAVRPCATPSRFGGSVEASRSAPSLRWSTSTDSGAGSW